MLRDYATFSLNKIGKRLELTLLRLIVSPWLYRCNLGGLGRMKALLCLPFPFDNESLCTNYLIMGIREMGDWVRCSTSHRSCPLPLY